MSVNLSVKTKYPLTAQVLGLVMHAIRQFLEEGKDADGNDSKRLLLLDRAARPLLQPILDLWVQGRLPQDV